MRRKLVLLRHPAVCESVKGLCYGRSDVPLSLEGLTQIASIVEQIREVGEPDYLVHSGAIRTRLLSNALAEAAKLDDFEDSRLLERDFGDWELQSWDTIHELYGDEMMGMIESPNSWAPSGGETTFQMRDRVLDWFTSMLADLELADSKLIVAVTHGGPIACLRGTLLGLSVDRWGELIPPCGKFVLFELDPPRNALGI